MRQNFILGVSSMVASSVCVALTCYLGKALSENLSLSLVIFIRFFVPFLLSSWMLITLQSEKLTMEKPLLHILRAVCAVLGQYCLFYCLSTQSVLMATLLFCTGPLFVPLITACVYRTPISRMVWYSVGVGFLGVMYILQPDLHTFLNFGLLTGLGAGFFNACSQVTFHGISQKDSPLSASFFMFGLSMLITVGPMLMSWHQHHVDHEFSYMLDSDLLLILLAFSLCSMSNQMFRSKAYQYAKPTHMAPFWYLAIPLTALLDWQFKGLVPDVSAIMGCFFVVLGGLLMVYHKHIQESSQCAYDAPLPTGSLDVTYKGRSLE